MLWVFLAITVLFFLSLYVKRVCAICAAVSATWIVLLFMYWVGMFTDVVLLALLMGQSITGLLYLVRDRLPEFQLPIILTLILLAYILITHAFAWQAFVFVAILWVGVALLTQKKSFMKRLVECCKQW